VSGAVSSSATLIPSPAAAQSAGFRPSHNLKDSNSLRQSHALPDTADLPPLGEDPAAEEGSSGIWLGLGLALALLLLAALVVFLVLFVRRRKRTEDGDGQSQDSAEPPETWTNTIHEDDEEFVDYVNPLDLSGAAQESGDEGFDGPMGE
jgi:hypothetical protein